MSLVYTVCNSGHTTTRNLANLGWVNQTDTKRYYMEGDCSVIETSNILQFTSFTPVDTPFQVWYSYYIKIYIDLVYQPPAQYIVHTVTMMPGQHLVNIPLIKDLRYTCTSTVPAPPPTP